MFLADVRLCVFNQSQDLAIVFRHKRATQGELAGWDPVANAQAGGAAVLRGPRHRQLPTPVTLVVTGLAIGTGTGLLKLAVEPIGIGLMAFFKALAAGRMLAGWVWAGWILAGWLGSLAAHGNDKC